MRSGKRMPSSRQTEDTCELRYPTLLLEHQREYVSTIWDYGTPVALVECGAAATTNVGCSPSPKCGDRVMMRYMTVGLSVLVGVAVFEVALIPAVAIGGAAILAPTYLRRRRVEPIADGVARPPVEVAAPVPQRQKVQSRLSIAQRLAVGSALAKTITFRVVVTTIDFTSNYVGPAALPLRSVCRPWRSPSAPPSTLRT